MDLLEKINHSPPQESSNSRGLSRSKSEVPDFKRSLLNSAKECITFLCYSCPPPGYLRPHSQPALDLTKLPKKPFFQKKRSLAEHQKQRGWHHSDPLFKTEVPPTSRQHAISVLLVSLQSSIFENSFFQRSPDFFIYYLLVL